MKKLGSLFLFCFLSACMVGPDYQMPSSEVPEKWANAQENNTKKPKDIQQEITWWENFKDPLLTQLIREALKSNYELKVAFATIWQARASLLGAEAALAPEIDGIGSFSHNENSLNTVQFSNQQGLAAVSISTGSGAGATRSRYFNLYRAGFDTTWEIDLFGRLRRGVESAEASLDAQVESMHGTLLSLIAEVAFNYINLRSYQKQLELTEKSFRDWGTVYKINQALLKAGLVTDINVTEAKTALDQTEASLSPLKENIKATMHQLSVLVGKPPAFLYTLLCKMKPIPHVPPQIFAGLPSELLKRRPDIRGAERTLAAATAQIGVAEGELYPIFTFTSTIGYQSNFGSNLFTPNSGFYSFGPGFTWNLVDFGRVRAKINSAMALRDEDFFQYNSILLNALADVENSLVNYAEEAKRFRALKSAFEASKQTAYVSLLRYESGLATFLAVLEAEIAYQTDAINLVQSQATLAISSVALYKALGGGWEIDRTCWFQPDPLVLWPETKIRIVN